MHEQFMAWLHRQDIPFDHDRMDKATVTTCGQPDFACFTDGRVAFVEFKFRKGKLSPVQKRRIRELRDAGNEVCVAYDLPTAINHVETAFGFGKSDWGALRKRNEALRQGGDAPCPSICKDSPGSNGASQSNPAPAPDTGPCFGYPEGSFQPAPKLWMVSSRIGDVIVERRDGKEIFVRMANAEDVNVIPRWSEALS